MIGYQIGRKREKIRNKFRHKKSSRPFWGTLCPPTLSHGEQVAEVGGRVERRRLGALDVAQGQEGLVVGGGEVRQAEEVVALLGVEIGARDATVQHLGEVRYELMMPGPGGGATLQKPIHM